MSDYDSPWKDALDAYLEAFLALFFPDMHRDIDWRRGYVTLDKELQKIAPDSKDRRRIVDKLVKVWRKSGAEEWVLIHIEVQGQRESRFARRMFIYNCRIVERYHKSAVSVAVLADKNPGWRPGSFRRELWNCSVDFRFPTVKLLDYAAKSDELEQSGNPFAKFVLAHLKAIETQKDNQTRYTWKLRLVRGLFERGLAAGEIRKLFRLIDWVMKLPEELSDQFRDELTKIEEEKHMPYVTSIERLGIKKGRKEGKKEGWESGLKRGIRAVVNARFGEEGLRLMPEIDEIHDSILLETILDEAPRVDSLEQLQTHWKHG